MSNATSFTPDEPLAVLQAERGIIAAICLAWGAWGVVLALTVQCISVLSRNLKRTWNKFLIFYVFAIFSLCTIAESTHLKWLQMLFVDDRAIPGGPLAYDKQFYASAINVSGTTCDFIINYLSDLLLLYRLFLIYERKFLIILLPSMIFLTQLGLSVVDLITLSQPGNNMFTHSAINFGLLYWSFSVSFNVLVTSLIVGRLLYHRNRILSVVGGNHGKLYITLSSVLIESSALYTIAALIFLGGYASQTPVQFAGEVAEIIQGIAPLLIILRVANGKAYDETTLAMSTQVHAARRASHSGPVFAPRIQMEAGYSIDTPGDSTAQDYAMDSMQHIAFNKDEGNKGDKAWIQ